MSNNYALEGVQREGTGKGVARALRRENKIPAVIYGDNKTPVTITLPAKEVNMQFNTGQMFTTLCDLKVGSDKHLVLARDVQLHPVKDYVLHVDFLRVTKKTKIAVEVPVTIINEEKAPGLKDEGGVLNLVRYRVELLCSATDIPEEIEVDVTGKTVGDSINISDAKMPEGAKPVIDDRDFTIATIVIPRSIEDLEAADEAEDELLEGEEGEAADGEAAEEKSAEE